MVYGKDRYRTSPLPDVAQAAREQAAKTLQHHINSIIGVNTKINAKSEGEVARSPGKVQRVADLR